MGNFADELIAAIRGKESALCIGLDTAAGMIPEHMRTDILTRYRGRAAVAKAISEYNKRIIDAVEGVVPAVKPNLGFYLGYGPEGMQALEDTVTYAHDAGLIVILDQKSGDIFNTAEMYAAAGIGRVPTFDEGDVLAINADASTVVPYMGRDGIDPFTRYVKEDGKGIFVIGFTSNPSRKDIEELKLETGEHVFEKVGGLIEEWGADHIGDSGYSSVGVVIGATGPTQAGMLRQKMPRAFALVPGVGAQGADAEDVVPSFGDDGFGAIVNISRDGVAAYQRGYADSFTARRFAEAARQSAIDVTSNINAALEKADKKYW
ncbi:MAG: orotidine-5'-phosphate decarboxylase [Candidatus Aenigmatarchaeota archaeon]